MTEEQLTYRRRIRAWTLYDWANSAFATTILAAVLPVYYSQVAGSTLPSPSVATAYWSTGLSLSILIGALLAPVLGTISDIMRGKKLLLSLFAGLGVVCTGLLVLVKSGDWLLASLLFVFGRLGFGCSIIFYDALLPHVARPEDQDRVSTRGYALGYLGGGLLLAVNVAMIQLLPGTWGPRLSFLSVALWWALFSIPVLRTVPEPHTLTARAPGQGLWAATWKRLGETLRDIRRYRELFKFLLAHLVYIDGVGTIIGIAAIYGAELGLGSVELILALLLVQFAGIPFSLLFGSLPRPEGEDPAARRARWRPLFLAFVVANLLLLPLLGLVGSRRLPAGLAGASPPPYRSEAGYAGQGLYGVQDRALSYSGSWVEQPAPHSRRARQERVYCAGERAGDHILFAFNGEKLTLTYAAGPEFGIWNLELDGRPLAGADGRPQFINCWSSTPRWELAFELAAPAPGRHTLRLSNNGEKDTRSSGTRLAIGSVRVLAPQRRSSLPLIFGLILALEAVCAGLALLLGRPLFGRLAARLTTQAGLVLALVVYAVIAIYGFFLDSVLDYWCLAWMVACVQGGSQALSRSLFASLIPAAKSGEFFSLFAIMEKFATLLGPLLFAGAVALFGSSRPAVLSLILFFLVGIVLLLRVKVEQGRQVARAEDEELKGELQ